ncbi:MAG: cell envelope integrity protein CreD [Pseudomonadota bacterium]
MSTSDTARRILSAPSFKFVLVLVLILALTIPLLFVYALVYEREQRARQATTSISQMWGGRQTMAGPYIAVPTERARVSGAGANAQTVTERNFAVFLPETLNVTSDLKTEERRRGIFTVPVYRSTHAFEGRFAPATAEKISQSVDRVLWQEAVIVVLVSDVRGIVEGITAELGGLGSRAFRAGSGLQGRHGGAIHIPVSEQEASNGFSFKFSLGLRGSQVARFMPAGGDTNVAMAADWPHPSFSGGFLPDSRSISEAGFEATWSIPRLARGTAQTQLVSNLGGLRVSRSEFGVDLFQPVRFYSLAQRALKYAIGFIGIAFFAVFIMEVQARRRVHWIQYLFVGLALVIFYVLLIGTAEHIGFDLAYLAASTATSLLIGVYFGSVVGSRLKGFVLFALLGIIYALLYLLLRLEDYALLVGSIAAFVTIAIVMFVTRNIDWGRGIDTEKPPQAQPAE